MFSWLFNVILATASADEQLEQSYALAYTASLKELNLMTKPVEGVSWPPDIMVTLSGWEAELDWNGESVIIRKDGKVWVK